MVEVMENMSLCGVLLYNDSWCEVFCDKYGVLAFDNYTDGMWCISEVNIGEPLELDKVNDLVSNIDKGYYGECIGVVYGSDGTIVVFLDDDKAVKRHVWSLKENDGEPFYYSTDKIGRAHV